MSTLTRKQREIRQREETILDIARKVLVEQGYAGLNMDRIAELTEYSKGVLYTHFKSKEDIVAALAVQSLRERVERFQKAAHFEGRPRERMLAISVAEELFVRLRPYHFQAEQVIKLASLHERASPERLAELRREEGNCFRMVVSVLLQAIECGDIVLAQHTHPADIVFSLWALNFGCFTILHTERGLLAEHGITTPYTTVRKNCHILLDGYQWKPLSTEWDYEASYRRILSEVFPEECLQAGLG